MLPIENRNNDLTHCPLGVRLDSVYSGGVLGHLRYQWIEKSKTMSPPCSLKPIEAVPLLNNSQLTRATTRTQINHERVFFKLFRVCYIKRMQVNLLLGLHPDSLNWTSIVFIQRNIPPPPSLQKKKIGKTYGMSGHDLKEIKVGCLFSHKLVFFVRE